MKDNAVETELAELAAKSGLEEFEKLLEFKQVAWLLGVSRPALTAIIKEGELPALKVGSLWRVRPADLKTYMSRRDVPRETVKRVAK